MNNNTTPRLLLLAVMLFIGFAVKAQTTTTTTTTTSDAALKTYLIERDIPDAGKLTPAQLKGISQKSCTVLKDLGPDIKWMHSYVTGNKIMCVYKAKNEEIIREHAKKGGFPVTSITEVATTISPATAN